MPSFTVRNAETTVQLIDGQSFAIAGLIKNNSAQTVKRFPMLGEIPIIGALFRSSEFQEDKTELVFVVTPRLAKPLPPNYSLPTDNAVPPSRSEFFLGGKMEGSAPADQSVATTPPQSAGGFEMR
jgi:pilus assembly protein CpaC